MSLNEKSADHCIEESSVHRKSLRNKINDEGELERRYNLTCEEILEELRRQCPMGYDLHQTPGGWHCFDMKDFFKSSDVEDFRAGKIFTQGYRRENKRDMAGIDWRLQDRMKSGKAYFQWPGMKFWTRIVVGDE